MFDLLIEFYVHAFAVILPALVVAIFAYNGKLSGMNIARMSRLLVPLIVFLGLWYALATNLAKAGLLAPPTTIADPPYILAFLFGGTFILWAYGRFTSLGRQVINGTDQVFLIGFQIPRIMGGVFLVGWAVGVIPWEFALPAGVGDVWAGIAGLQAARAIRRGDSDAYKKTMQANVIGLLDFLIAIVTGLLTSQGFLHMLSKDSPNIINDYPLVLFPAFFVPLFIAFHLFSIGKLLQSNQMVPAQ